MISTESSSVSQPARGVRIDLGVCSLGELLGLLGRTGPFGAVEVATAELEGTVHLVGPGQAVSRAGGLRGLDAALALLDAEAGMLCFRRNAGEPPACEVFAIEDALLQHAWLEDELRHRNGSVPGEGT
jgi:hypothetical protein